MAHMGAQFEHGLHAVADCPNVAVDYAGTVNEKGAYETALRLLGPDRIVFVHTEVLPEFGGAGVGSALAAAALDEARRHGLAVIPQCPYIRGYIDRHPDYADLVTAVG